MIDIPDDDFGVWYVDVMDHPDRYKGKLVHMKLVMCHSTKYPGVDCPGRFAMVCCEKDVSFLGLLARGEGLSQYKNHDWIEVTARMGVEKHPAYKGEGPVMQIVSNRQRRALFLPPAGEPGRRRGGGFTRRQPPTSGDGFRAGSAEAVCGNGPSSPPSLHFHENRI